MKTCDRDECTVLTQNVRFCSKHCSAVVTNSESPRRTKSERNPSCYFCGADFSDLWQQKRYCGTSCQQGLRRAYLLNEWLSGRNDRSRNGRIPGWAREYLISLRGEACEICGWNELHPRTGRVPLEFDHIDGDRSNNQPENFKILCPNHHALTATWGFTSRA